MYHRITTNPTLPETLDDGLHVPYSVQTGSYLTLGSDYVIIRSSYQPYGTAAGCHAVTKLNPREFLATEHVTHDRAIIRERCRPTLS